MLCDYGCWTNAFCLDLTEDKSWLITPSNNTVVPAERMQARVVYRSGSPTVVPTPTVAAKAY
jgi:hypothetical protein